jgi:NADH-quinone oxidoreductase subunit K
MTDMAGSLFPYLLLGLLLLSLGLYGVLARRNLVLMLIGLELILNGINLTLLALNRYSGVNTASGEVIAIFIIALAAAETTIALGLIYLTFRHSREIDAERLRGLKG